MIIRTFSDLEKRILNNLINHNYTRNICIFLYEIVTSIHSLVTQAGKNENISIRDNCFYKLDPAQSRYNFQPKKNEKNENYRKKTHIPSTS